MKRTSSSFFKDRQEVAFRPHAFSSDPEIEIPADGKILPGNLMIPKGTAGIVLFAHGSGSSRHSPRNRYVAQMLEQSKFATLLFDLLTPEEDQNYETRFDIPLLARRLVSATQWLKEQPEVKELSLGYFGASTGAAAALIAAADLGKIISCVVLRGGRPDLAMEILDRITAPTLLIVGELDDVVIELNRKAYKALRCKKELSIIPEATHLFEEPGTLEEVSRQAAKWFDKYLK
jgi:putative phosphoribosyl transferase